MKLSHLALTFALAVAGVGPGHAAPSWHSVAVPDMGFSVQAPSDGKVDPAHPGKFDFAIGDSSFIVDVDALDDNLRLAVAKGDQAIVVKALEAMRDTTVESMKATRRTSSSTDFAGHPSVLFTFDGTYENKPFTAKERVVLTDRRMYLVVAIGATKELKTADVDAFLGSFTLIPGSPWRVVSFTDAVCGRIPPVPISFEMPDSYVARAVGSSAEAGCLWGEKDDLDRVTVDPTQGDFSALRHGVFRARISTEVVNSPETGIFDQMDGAGEAGMRRTIEQVGAKVLVWKKETIAGLPALENVADLGKDRVYMLYLGNTRFVSNTLLVNYYPPAKRGAADDQMWARFVTAIARSGPTR